MAYSTMPLDWLIGGYSAAMSATELRDAVPGADLVEGQRRLASAVIPGLLGAAGVLP